MEIKTNVTNALNGAVTMMAQSTTEECLAMSINDLAKACKENLYQTSTVKQAEFSKYFGALFVKSAKYMPNMFYQFKSILADDLVMQLNESILSCLDKWDESIASFKTFLWGDFRFGLIRQERLARMQKRRVFHNYKSIQSQSDDDVYIISDIKDESVPSEFRLNIEVDRRFTKKEKHLIMLFSEGYNKREAREEMGMSLHKFNKMVRRVAFVLKNQ